MKIVMLLFLIIIIIAASSCGKIFDSIDRESNLKTGEENSMAIQKGNSKETEKENNNKAEKLRYLDISPEEAKKRLEAEEGIILLDVRTPEEYAEKHIPGSLLIPVDVIAKEAPGKLTDKNAVIFVYCRSGRRSVTAANALVQMGYTNVYNLGGIIDWPYETQKAK